MSYSRSWKSQQARVARPHHPTNDHLDGRPHSHEHDRHRTSGVDAIDSTRRRDSRTVGSRLLTTERDELRIADLSVLSGRYEFAVETDTQQVTTTGPLSPQGQRRYERLDIRVLPDRLSVENAEI